ncbi:response regulator [Metabacillus niabensis]|uniref:YesN/AraC family two-component response regulator n=2 Tax=Metabacillus niabensis TaxID=324854 RepID=A0ABT9Z548_9BACI|nr:response regulator [Metabacillus niabensis]MDQ0227386.1 YesN/AraC family two-component response regulator [Metabacillus niabensis]
MREVMIVDDDQSVIKGLLTHIPWNTLDMTVIDSASNGEEALEKIRRHQPDILITDIYMPKLNGIELIRTINKEFPSIYIMIHSGYNHFENAREAIKYGVKHFFLKPSTVEEMEAVLSEVTQDMEAEEKQKRLMAQYNKQLKEYLSYTKDALLREMLLSKFSLDKISIEKLELVNLRKDALFIVASLELIRPPYLTKSKERDWQLLKLSTMNIMREIISGEEEMLDKAEVNIIDYSDSSFVLVFIAKADTVNLTKFSCHLSQILIENILRYLKLSSNVGVGQEKKGLNELNNSFLESQKALEVAEYQEINQVITYDEIKSKNENDRFSYPFDTLKEIKTAISNKEYNHILKIWGKFETYVMTENTPLYIVQNICFSIINALMLEYYSEERATENSFKMAENVMLIYQQHTSKDLMSWMSSKLVEWHNQVKDELIGKKSNKLIRGVKEYVQNYYDQEITLAEIADSLYVNKNYLSQLFKKVTGETFVTYLNRFRIEKAKEKLRQQHYMVYEVSEMVGYQNPTYFSQVFKSITGVSPSEFYKM